MTNPYDELIQRVEQSTQSLIRSNFARDARRERLEKRRTLLLTLILVGVWAIFFLLCARPDGGPQFSPEPTHPLQPPAHYQIKQPDEPIYAI